MSNNKTQRRKSISKVAQHAAHVINTQPTVAMLSPPPPALLLAPPPLCCIVTHTHTYVADCVVSCLFINISAAAANVAERHNYDLIECVRGAQQAT